MERKEQISAVLDGELDDAAWKTLTQNWTQDDQDALGLYGAVGDVLRASSLAAFHSSIQLDSIQAAIAKETTVLAPTLRNSPNAWSVRFAKPLHYVERAALCGFAILALTLSLNKTVPVQMSDIQMVKSSAGIKISEEDLAAWNDLVLAHRQYSPSGVALGGRVPVAGSQDIPQRVNVSNQEPSEWMNIWEQEAYLEAPVYFNYVSSIH